MAGHGSGDFQALRQCYINTVVIWTVHKARRFYLDLTAELRRLRSKRYPQGEWHRALEREDTADLARAVMARNGSDDADYFDHQHSYQMLEADRDPYNAHRAKTARAEATLARDRAKHPDSFLRR